MLPTQQLGKNGPTVPRMALGCMGLSGTWNPADIKPDALPKAIKAYEAALESGITFFDHADIYGQTTCESMFKDCMKAVPYPRENLFIATKCGIVISPHQFNLSSEHIIRSIEGSLTRLGLDYVDLYQMHRPDPLAHPRDTAAGIREIVKRGLARHVGVSNYYPEQVRALLAHLDDVPVITNQISISLVNREPIYEHHETGVGILDQCMGLDITPLAYSPLGAGCLSGHREMPADHPRKAEVERTLARLREVGDKQNATPAQVALAWLMAHPARIVPIVGSNNPDHIREAAGAVNVTVSRADWYALLVAGRGQSMP